MVKILRAVQASRVWRVRAAARHPSLFLPAFHMPELLGVCVSLATRVHTLETLRRTLVGNPALRILPSVHVLLLFRRASTPTHPYMHLVTRLFLRFLKPMRRRSETGG